MARRSGYRKLITSSTRFYLLTRPLNHSNSGFFWLKRIKETFWYFKRSLQVAKDSFQWVREPTTILLTLVSLLRNPSQKKQRVLVLCGVWSSVKIWNLTCYYYLHLSHLCRNFQQFYQRYWYGKSFHKISHVKQMIRKKFSWNSNNLGMIFYFWHLKEI